MRESKKWAITFWGFFLVDPFLRALILTVGLASMFASRSPRGGSGASFIMILFGIGVFALSIFFLYKWFVCDAQENGVYPSGGLKASVILIAVIGVPYYLFKYKGFKEGIKSLSIIVVLFICMISIQTFIGKMLQTLN